MTSKTNRSPPLRSFTRPLSVSRPRSGVGLTIDFVMTKGPADLIIYKSIYYYIEFCILFSPRDNNHWANVDRNPGLVVPITMRIGLPMFCCIIRPGRAHTNFERYKTLFIIVENIYIFEFFTATRFLCAGCVVYERVLSGGFIQPQQTSPSAL